MAVNQSSPGVVVQERDLTTITSLSTANVGVLAAPFELGPVEEIVNISTERELVEQFGKPNDYNYEYWYTAAQYLNYGGVLKTVRVNSTALKNAVDTGAAPLIKNLTDYETTIESANNTWSWAAKTAGTKGNSIGVFVTDAGADQIAVIPAPGSGNEFEFVNDAAVSAASGAAGKVFKYSIVLTVTTVVGDFTPGVSTTIAISGSNETVDVLAWDPANKKLEIGLPAGGVTGIVVDAQTITQGTNTAVIATAGIERKLYIAKNKDSVDFAAADSIEDTNTNAAAIASVRGEYDEREYLPGVKWVNTAPRPGTSQWATTAGGFRDELHVLVIDVDGAITGTAGALLERFVGVSKASDAKTSVGETNYYSEVIKQRSAYIYWGEHETTLFSATATPADGNWGLAASARQFNLLRSVAGTVDYPAGRTTVGSASNATYYYRLANGADYTLSGGTYSVSNSDVSTSYELVEDPESQTVDFILTGPSGPDDASAIAKITSLVNIVEERRDCMVFASPRRANVIGISNSTTATNNIIDFFDQLPSSSYAVYDSGYKYIYDKYNDVYRYVPCNGDVAGLCLQTTEVAEPWFSPAGFQRGNLRNAIKLAYTPNKTQRDRLYSARVNPIVSFPGQGVVLYGDKTAQGFASAFDRINVRRLFLTIERVISGAAKSQLFEQNDESQRALFLNIVEPYLRDVQGRRGVTDFLVKCDTQNNPPEAVDRGEFYAEIFVKPTRTINYITLTFVATRTGVAFSEVAS
ncbi:tail sheath monomer [Cyanophage S-RIM12 isolate W1_08_0910]|uniref:Tail sheath monomer n=3 Tax=Brizovirus TaxID=2733098 RepID=A0A1D7SQT6_9CAUD|nr:tail sheath [Cyanophage S-RIM12 isolate RW_06_0310]YP_009779517.1 tail sheath [Cyanophage S-RIM12 isolate W1_08_0910]AOO15381.1 tail sheath monomer [Cyanophage S-RIM12_Np_15_0310]AOO16021.1 tail sheath monomer [Cyanophage S-RIM12_RW_04_0310]AOO19241.1 tail sheath monomer [Cyanophage S-RIM12_WH_05_0310]AOO16450.1 tail sheath monomer [Cyanophage S-RIM12 isolate RW_06_0310]AOO18599.1 tail sheath monomer [Cyanophage S-RIM12 isolate W1_08_0910]